MKLEDIDMYRNYKDDVMRHGTTRGFAEHDGDYESNHLSLKRKEAADHDRMRMAHDVYQSAVGIHNRKV